MVLLSWSHAVNFSPNRRLEIQARCLERPEMDFVDTKQLGERSMSGERGKHGYELEKERAVGAQIHQKSSDALSILSAPNATDFQKHKAWETLKNLEMIPGE